MRHYRDFLFRTMHTILIVSCSCDVVSMCGRAYLKINKLIEIKCNSSGNIMKEQNDPLFFTITLVSDL